MNKDQMPKNGSAYLEAFPFHRTVLDVCDLEASEREFAKVLTDHLFVKKTELTFQSHSKSQDKLHHLYFESRNWERLGGQRCGGLGFPLCLSKQASSVRLAPLLIWPVSIDPDPHRPNFWTIRTLSGRTPFPNPLLVPDVAGIPPSPWPPGSMPDLEEIEAYGQALAEAAECTWQEAWSSPFPIPPLEILSDLQNEAVALPCMVLGAFKPVFPERAGEDHWAYSSEILERDPYRQAFERSQFSPFQAKAWEEAQTKHTLLLEEKDPDATLEWVVDLLYHALSNGERLLVLSDRLGRLSQIQQQLTALKAGWLTFLLKDPYQDSYLLAELIKARLDKEDAPPAFPKDDFNMLLAKCHRHKEKLDRSAEALHKPILGPYTWTDLAGLFLKSSAIEGKELLSSQLTTQDFLFQYEEYEACKIVIAQSIPLYNRINTLKHPLTALHPGHFLHREKTEALEKLDRDLETYTAKLEALNHELLRQTDAYALKLNDHFEHTHLSLNARLNQLLEMVSDFSHKYGEAFHRGGTGSRIKGLFNKRAKAMAEARESITQAYLTLARYHEERSAFGFSFLPNAEARNMSRVETSLEEFNKMLNEWRQRIRDRVMEEVSRLNRQTVFPELGLQETIDRLEDSIEAELAEFNEARIYAEVVDANMLTIPKKQKFLDSLLEKLETTRLNLRDFDAFYDWQRHWLQLSDPQQRLMRALIKVKPQNWTSAFESWYFHHCLNRNFSDDLPTDDQALKVFNEAWTALQGFLPAFIPNIWLERQQKAIKNWKKHNKAGFQNWTGKGKREGAPADWFGSNWEALHQLFPVWMMPDGLAAQLYNTQNAPELDWVIVWEHQEFEPAIWHALAPKVRHWIVIGDGHGKLEARLRALGWPSCPIRGLPSARVYQVALDQAPLAESRPEVQLLAANGLYDPSAQTNEAEAQEIVRLLNEIRPTPARTFPSVAILTLTIAQRDLIATYLLQIKQRNLQGSEKIRSLERNGLAILHIDEFYGSTYDQLIVSTTIGPANAQGALPADIAYFTTADWDRAGKALRHSKAPVKAVVHSFTEGQLTGSRLKPFRALLDQLPDKTEEKAPEEAEAGIPVFHRELQSLLESYFDTWQFRLKPPPPELNLPVLLRQEDNPSYATALLPDLLSCRLPVTSYTWEWRVREQLLHQGYPVQNAWSVLFWRNPRQEARKLAGHIIAAYNKLQKEESRIEPEEEATTPPPSEP